MTPSPQHHRLSLGGRILRFLKRLLLTTVVVALGGATVFLLSQLNAKTYTLENHDRKLVVYKGRMLPFGAEPWLPADAALADAYAPLELEGTSPIGITNVKYDDRDSLDRALFSVIEGLAKARVSSDDPVMLDRGLYFLRRAERLSGITDEQRVSLKQMKSDVAFYIARKKLEEGQREIEEALGQLKLAAGSDSRHARAATQMISSVEPKAKGLADALREAVNLLSAPAAPAAPPEPPRAAPPAPIAPVPEAADAGAATSPSSPQ